MIHRDPHDHHVEQHTLTGRVLRLHAAGLSIEGIARALAIMATLVVRTLRETLPGEP